MTPGQHRFQGAVLGVPLALIIVTGGTSIYLSDPANPLAVTNIVQVSMYLLLVFASIMSLAIVAYWMREHRRVRYGVFEVLFGVALIVITFFQLINAFGGAWSFLRWQYLAQLLAAIYVMVRGFDNIGHGVKAHPVWERRWRWFSLWPPVDAASSPTIASDGAEADILADQNAPIQRRQIDGPVAKAELTPEASRAARAILKWSLRDLAENVGITFTTVHRFETTGVATEMTKESIRSAYAAHNVEITNGLGAGARLVEGLANSASEKFQD